MDWINTREYKLILAADRFYDRKDGSDAFQDLAAYLVDRAGGKVKRQDSEEDRRTRYLDTAGFGLRSGDYVLRLRDEKEAGDTKITLKYRGADLILAEAASVKAADKDAREKFEEDLLPPRRSVFSRSSSIRMSKAPDLGTVGDAERLFPGLKQLDLPKKAGLSVVNRFTAFEVFRKLMKIDFGGKQDLKMGLSFWYHGKDAAAGKGSERSWPLIAECAFDFKADGKSFDLNLVRQANALFSVLQRQPGWFNPDATTKTRYAYEGLTL